MVRHPPSIKTYDSRLGQDCVFFASRSKRPMFSSLEHDFYVVEAVGEMGWDMHQELILECILKTSTKGFFAVVPWHPGAGKLKGALLQQFPDSTEIDHSVLGYFDSSADQLSRLFSIRGECGGGDSGEWCIGGCSMIFELDKKCVSWDLNCLLHQAEKIGCVLSLEEMQQSYFMTKPFDGLPKIIRTIAG